MYYEVAEVSRHRDSSLVYVLCSFWTTKAAHDAAPNDPELTNDFLMQLIRSKVAKDGTVITWTDAELQQLVRTNITEYWQRAQAAARVGQPYPKKHDQREKIVRNRNDPDTVLERIASLEGATEERADR
jgi:hypothetical protein